MGRIIFGLLTISKNCRLLLYILFSLEVVMVNPLQCTIVVQHQESKGIVSLHFVRFIQILGYLANTCTPKFSK